MILDYDYNQREKKFVISYINEKGTKSFYECSVSRFKTYYPTPTGKYRNWDDTPCDVKYTERPSKFDIKEFIEDLPENAKKYIARIEELLEVPVSIVSVGADRNQTIFK